MGKKETRRWFLLFVPLIFAIASVIYRSFPLMFVSLILCILVVAFVPFCNKNESVWIALTLAITMLPINFYLTARYEIWSLISTSETLFSMILSTFTVAIVLLGIEEVLVGVIGSLVYQNQEVMNIPEE